MYTIHSKRRREKIEIKRLKSETKRNTLKSSINTTIWNMLNLDLKSANNLLDFKKLLTQNCTINKQILFSKGTTINMNNNLGSSLQK